MAKYLTDASRSLPKLCSALALEAVENPAHNLAEYNKQGPGKPDGGENKQSGRYQTAQAAAGIELSQTGGAGTVDKGAVGADGFCRGRRQLADIFVT